MYHVVDTFSSSQQRTALTTLLFHGTSHKTPIVVLTAHPDDSGLALADSVAQLQAGPSPWVHIAWAAPVIPDKQLFTLAVFAVGLAGRMGNMGAPAAVPVTATTIEGSAAWNKEYVIATAAQVKELLPRVAPGGLGPTEAEQKWNCRQQQVGWPLPTLSTTRSPCTAAIARSLTHPSVSFLHQHPWHHCTASAIFCTLV